MKKLLYILFISHLLSTLPGSLSALAASGDLTLSPNGVWFSTENYLEGSTIRIWASVQNNSPNDLLGVVRFSTNGDIIDSDQPISALAGKTDEVFVDWVPSTYGDFNLSVTVIPWDSTSDNPDNNAIQKEVAVYQDTDRDGVPNTSDIDKDGDGITDEVDAFPLTYSEFQDSDGDGEGDNADQDDDNDGTLDSEDQLPVDSRYTEDQDGDGLADEVDEDRDGDGLLNEEEDGAGTDANKTDTDGDGSTDSEDAFPNNSTEWEDGDEDTIGNNSDPDIDGDGIENTKDLDPYNPAPTANIVEEVFIANLGEEIFFDGSASQDDSGISQFVWLFGNSDSGDSKEGEVGFAGTTEGPRTSHVFTTKGLQTATLTVYDESGQSDTLAIKVRVLDYGFILKTAIFSVLLLSLAFYLIYRYTRRRSTRSEEFKTRHSRANKKKRTLL